jgi:hypothetical protein
LVKIRFRVILYDWHEGDECRVCEPKERVRGPPGWRGYELLKAAEFTRRVSWVLYAGN